MPEMTSPAGIVSTAAVLDDGACTSEVVRAAGVFMAPQANQAEPERAKRRLQNDITERLPTEGEVILAPVRTQREGALDEVSRANLAIVHFWIAESAQVVG